MRGSLSAIVLLVAPAFVAAGFAGCTDGTTAICDDAGTCLIGVPPDGGIVVDGSLAPDSGADGSGPAPDGASGLDTGAPADAGGGGGDASDGMAAGGG